MRQRGAPPASSPYASLFGSSPLRPPLSAHVETPFGGPGALSAGGPGSTCLYLFPLQEDAAWSHRLGSRSVGTVLLPRFHTAPGICPGTSFPAQNICPPEDGLPFQAQRSGRVRACMRVCVRMRQVPALRLPPPPPRCSWHLFRLWLGRRSIRAGSEKPSPWAGERERISKPWVLSPTLGN